MSCAHVRTHFVVSSDALQLGLVAAKRIANSKRRREVSIKHSVSMSAVAQKESAVLLLDCLHLAI